jgi:hypothetical protein
VNTTAGGSYNFGSQLYTLNNVENEGKSRGYGMGVSLAPGLSYKLTTRFLVDAYLSNFIFIVYSHSKTTYSSPTSRPSSTQNSFNLLSSLSNTNLGNVGIGFRWLIKR